MEKIEIKNFVGIKDITLEVKKINILIGPQASGKSIIAKLLFYFKNFIFEIISSAQQFQNLNTLEVSYTEKFKEYFPPSSWGDSNFTIKYYIEDKFIQVQKEGTEHHADNSKIDLTYSDFYRDKFLEYQEKIKDYKEQLVNNIIHRSSLAHQQLDLSNIKEKFLSDLSSILSNNTVSFEQLYIPASRSFFANIKNNLFSLLSNSLKIDPFIVSFGEYYGQTKDPMLKHLLINKQLYMQDVHQEIMDLNYKILGGQYIQIKDEDFLQVGNNRKVSIINSSSGQQETLPLTIILEFIALTGNKISTYIEEPEAHVFPSTQKNIVELNATVYNARKDNLQFFITTHSPYILTSFNNLIQAGILAEDATEEKIEQIAQHVPQSRFLNPDEVAVYSLENGYCQSIIDPETKLIDANIIDEVSNELAIQFDELLDLEE